MSNTPAKKLQPIIIKRVKKGGHGGHHGGAWKIAYADFVTAMMAFFLLMWLLGSTSQGDLKGISDYFNSPLKVALAGGSGSGDSSSVVKGGGTDLSRSSGQVKRGDVLPANRDINLVASREEQRNKERQGLVELAQKVDATLAANPKLNELRSQIRMDITRDGLRIQIIDAQNRPMFDSGNATLKDYTRDLMRTIGGALNDVPNRIMVAGHTDSQRYGAGDRGYSNWELSTDRANAARRELVAGGMQETKLIQVVGLAAALPLDTSNPAAPVNRRISLTIMNSDAEQRVLQTNGAGTPDPAEGEVAARIIDKAVRRVGAPVTPAVGPSVGQPSSPAPGQPMSQSANQPSGQSANQPVKLSAK